MPQAPVRPDTDAPEGTTTPRDDESPPKPSAPASAARPLQISLSLDGHDGRLEIHGPLSLLLALLRAAATPEKRPDGDG